MSSRDKKKSESRRTLRKLMKFIAGYKWLLALSILLAAASVIMQLYVPVLFGNAIDEIISEHNVFFENMWTCLEKIAVVAIGAALFLWIMNLVNNRMTYKVVQDIRSKAMNHIQKLPLSYLDRHASGDIVSRIIADADILSDGLLLGFTQLFVSAVTVIATIAFMFAQNAWIALFVVMLTPLSFLVAKFIASRSFNMFSRQSEARGAQTALAEEMISGQKTVKAFGHEKIASKDFERINKQLQEYSQKAVFYSSLTNPSTRFVNNIIYAGVALIGVLFIPKGMLTVGGLSIMLYYANQYMKPFNDISSVVTEMQNALACAARIFELLEEPEEAGDKTDVLEDVKGRVDIENMYFSYTKESPLIQDFNLDVSPGMRIAVVGPTGCGKTTLINLLMRFYDADSGSIRIDGQSVNDISRHSLRGSFGMVLQDTWIKHGTIRENIAFGKPEASDEEIIRAAKEAHSWEFIEKLPDGLDTVLNEDSLSLGQKQLLCITRVMLISPPMLILDEATSNIDTRTELQIQEAFDRLMEGRTSFIVAHRLSTIRNASLIIVMNRGKIIEQGRHEELLAKGGLYSEIYNSQFQSN